MGTDAMGTVTFTGDDGSSALGAVTMLHQMLTKKHGMVQLTQLHRNWYINGLGGDNMFSYTSPTAAGFTFTTSYLPSSATGSGKSSTASYCLLSRNG